MMANESTVQTDYKGIKRGLEIKGDRFERKIIHRLSEYFEVTFAKEQNFKNSEYIFHFLKPTSSFRNSFNLYNEILVLFLNYERFDTRSFDFVDKLMMDYSNRLDKLCFIVISKDEQIEEKIEKYVKENDSRLIVPFTYLELVSEGLSEDYIITKFRRFFYSRDLFAFDSPLKTDNYFYGRKEILSSMLDNYRNGENSGLFGLRKIGKTSLLYAIARKIDYYNGVSVYIDAQNPSVYSLNWQKLLELIINKLILDYKVDKETVTYDDDTTSFKFEKDLVEIYNALGRKRIQIIIDEIENITFNIGSDAWKNGDNYLKFWQTIRSISQQNQELINFIISGVNPYIAETSFVASKDNPIYSNIKISYLNFFTLPESNEMLNNIGSYMGIKFDDRSVASIHETYGGHPYLIRKTGSIINSSIDIFERPSSVNLYKYKAYREEINENMIAQIENILLVLKKWYTDEYELLKVLCLEGSEQFLKKVGAKLIIIKHLMGYGIVTQQEGIYFITIELISEYIRNEENIKLKSPYQEYYTEINSIRNGIEFKLREIIRNTLFAKFGKEIAIQKCLEIVPSDSRDKKKTNNLDSLLEDLYFSDLTKIICKNFDLFSKIFVDKIKFEWAMEYINKYRVDAHTKKIEEDEYFFIKSAANYITNCISC